MVLTAALLCYGVCPVRRILPLIGGKGKESWKGLSQRVEDSRAQYTGVPLRAYPDVGANSTGAWVVGVCRRLLGRNCAAGEPPVRSGSGGKGCTWAARRGRRVSQASYVPDKNQKWRLAAGGNTPLRSMTERGVLELLKPSRLAEGGRLADEPD